ncbi:sodium/glutamate symporter [Pseudofrancisella aestuarii]|uniref:Sodium/glutamate symporter n=1 Tax=Pseudofrancisella aestuarii TaxID=2670347 RepID=A0ABV9TBW8_9GAMM|nr:sodium/glutamate symporter [Pseudofrancisella aestuarii]
MIEYNLNVMGTFFAAAIVLGVGRIVYNHVYFLRKFFIPIPVIGGIIISIILSILESNHIIRFITDGDVQRLLMVTFFATVGFSSSLKLLIRGGKLLFVFVLCTAVLVILQNILSISIAIGFNLSPLFGLANGSIPLVGGHGTSAAFSGVLEQFGLEHAATITTAAATFGLVCGGLLGGPIGHFIMKRHNLKPRVSEAELNSMKIETDEDSKLPISEHGLFRAIILLTVVITLGELVTYVFRYIGLIMPDYIGAMLIAAVARNISDFSKKLTIEHNEILTIGNISLSLFLAIVLMNIHFQALINMALSMCVILFAQVILMALFSYYITFKALGKDYDAAVLAIGQCGFGLGATPTAMANMKAFTSKNFPSPVAFFVTPLVGSLFIDFFNAATITTFLNFFK